MDDNIKSVLVDYKNCTAEIIELVDKDGFDSLEEVVDKRQKILESITSFPEKKSEVRAIYDDLKINELEINMKEVMQKKAVLIKKKLGNISKNKAASNAYIGFGHSAKIFSKKI